MSYAVSRQPEMAPEQFSAALPKDSCRNQLLDLRSGVVLALTPDNTWQAEMLTALNILGSRLHEQGSADAITPATAQTLNLWMCANKSYGSCTAKIIDSIGSQLETLVCSEQLRLLKPIILANNCSVILSGSIDAPTLFALRQIISIGRNHSGLHDAHPFQIKLLFFRRRLTSPETAIVQDWMATAPLPSVDLLLNGVTAFSYVVGDDTLQIVSVVSRTLVDPL